MREWPVSAQAANRRIYWSKGLWMLKKLWRELSWLEECSDPPMEAHRENYSEGGSMKAKTSLKAGDGVRVDVGG